jgi:NAD(P)-dependent dehydrogenase (short-subunit alcohol dehydrogenase family)
MGYFPLDASNASNASNTSPFAFFGTAGFGRFAATSTRSYSVNIDLSGKTAIVSASTAGIGLAIATGIAASGALTIVNGRKQEAVDRAIDSILKTAPHAKLQGFAGDLSTQEGCDALAKAVPQADILVNNLGVFGPGDVFSTEDEDWERYFRVNVMSGVRLTRYYLKAMMERKWGRVVFISSESGLNIPPDMLAYGFSKTAQLSIARGIAKHAAGSGVTVNSVLPGPTLSDGFRAMVEDTAKEQGKTVEQVATEFVREHRGSSLIQRAATTEEVANMVVYVCSPQASATTGAALRVDGGVIDTIA